MSMTVSSFMRSSLLQAAIFFLSVSGFSQSINNVVATVREDLITVEYDLKPGLDITKYKIQLYASYNNFNTPLTLVSGAVGEVEGGGRKTITWSARSELRDYSGEVSFEVRAEPIVVVKVLVFGSPVSGATVKRGKTMNIAWTGGSKKEPVQLQLMQKGTAKLDLGKQPNTGQYEWTVPKGTAKGEYQLFISSSSGSTMSMPFKVKPKTGAFIKIFPVVLVGAVVYFLASGSGGETPAPADNKLPVAPDPN
jgi:hypothetical protein